MKKILTILLVLAVTLCFASCTGGTGSTTEKKDSTETQTPDTKAEPAATTAAGKTSEKPLIGMSHFGVGTNNYTTVYTKTLNDLIKDEYKDDVEFYLLDAQGNAEKQLSDIEDLIEMKCDVVIVWPASSTAIVPGIQKLHDVGIPIINTNSGVDQSAQKLLTAFSGPSDFNQGRQAGEAMIDALGGEGKVVELAGTAGYDTSTQRSNGFADAIKDSKIELLASEPTDWSTEKAQTVMETFLTKYGDEIKGIYCADDGISAGAMNALDAAGKNDGSIAITSATLFASGYDAIAEGKQYASILQSPIEDAKLALKLAVQVSKGETVEYDNRIVTHIVDKKNYSKFDRPVW